MEHQLEMPKSEPKKAPKLARKHLIVACAVLLVAAALALNLTLFNGSDTVTPTRPQMSQRAARPRTKQATIFLPRR